LFNAVIRGNIAVDQAPSFDQALFNYAPKSHGAEDSFALGKEIIRKRPVPVHLTRHSKRLQ
jgi:chromosome partitioning protein